MPQENTKKKILVQINGEEVFLDQVALMKKLGVTAFIRIYETEFEDIVFKDNLYGHFNFEKTNHVIGSTYALVKIVRAGRILEKTHEEVPPVLSLDGAVIVECVDVQNNLPYSELDPSYFIHSMKGLTDQGSVLKRIHERYKSSRRDLSIDDVRVKGVGYTLLRFVYVTS